MPHDRLSDEPNISLANIDAAVRRAHQIRSRSITKFFKAALDRRYRALDVTSK